MKNIFSTAGILSLSVVLLSTFSLKESPQDPPHSKKIEKHIKLVKVDANGKKTKLDTVITNDNIFVWNGDTINGSDRITWVTDGDPRIIKVIADEEMGKSKVMIFSSDDDNSDIIFGAPHISGAPLPPRFMLQNQAPRNIIDLSDPGIISYEKKDLKGGKEKITIVRMKPTKTDAQIHEEVILHGAPMMQGNHQGEVKTIKVTSSDDGKIEIMENGKLIPVQEGSEEGQFISDDGKIIRIKKMKKDDGKTMEINVEVEEERK